MIDWNRVDALRNEVGKEDFEEVVDLFLEEVDETIQKLTQAGNVKQLEAYLHFLKGSSLNLGFANFSTLCRDAEVLVKQDAGAHIDLAAIVDSYTQSRVTFLERLGL